jgi:hypothetical protein
MIIRKFDKSLNYIKIILLSVFILSYWTSIHGSYNDAKSFSKEGHDIGILVSELMENIKKGAMCLLQLTL